MRKLLITGLFLFIIVSGFAQVKEKGTPLMRNFKKAEYGGGTQNWGISQDNRGFMYFANNNGVLQFDGQFWNLFTMPDSNKLVRSILCVGDTIYTGAFEEFGYFLRDNQKGLVYHSLMPLLKDKSVNIEEIWRITKVGRKIIFQSFSKVLIFEKETITIATPPEPLQFSFLIGKDYYVQGKSGNIYLLHGNTIERYNDKGTFKGIQVWAVLKISSEKYLFATINHGVWIFSEGVFKPWNNAANTFLVRNQIFSASAIPNGYIAFGTIQDGLLITQENGEVVQYINKRKGLQNNTILSTYVDCNHNLWLGLDNGIDYLELNSPLSYYNEGLGLLGACYSVSIFKSRFYAGTNQGVYMAPWETRTNTLSTAPYFERMETTNGQVWSLSAIDGNLFCGHNFGTFLVNNTAQKISEKEGSWQFLPLRNHPNKFIVGKYNGLHLYEKKNGSWQFSKEIAGFNESSRLLAEDEYENLWMAHGYKGIFKIVLNDQKDSVIASYLYDQSKGFPQSGGIAVDKVRNQVVFITSTGIFRYNAITDTMERYSEFNRLLKDSTNIRRLIEDKYGNIWVLKKNDISLLKHESSNAYKYVTTPLNKFGNSFVSSYENIFVDNMANIFVGTESGIIHYDATFPKTDTLPYACYIKQMRSLVTNGPVLFDDYGNSASGSLEIPYRQNSISIIYTAPRYSEQNLQYRVWLEGLDTDWSAATGITHKEYTNLSPGKYTFHVKARDSEGHESTEAITVFTIDYPRYLSKLAIVLYLLLLTGASMVARRVVKKKIVDATAKLEKEKEKELKSQEEAYEREALIAEKEIIKLRNEKLQAEIETKKIDVDGKNRELASIALHITHKNEFLSKIKVKLEAVAKKLSLVSQREVMELIQTIDSDIKLDNEWQRFELHFDEVHDNFLKKIKETYPTLTPHELKMCAYLRLNMSTKDIAQMLNITVRGVEISRYRLRKKLGIESETNLIDFMLSL
ncbi:triple tyrosine motif-containing protein [Williamwhitmania taraxaci]|uniref:Regulatory protein, luxR family n=1 Tax=Williamwhitmania taraxaci TaxID=1640674 RepID=A0A1G6N353_9BACT|nr:triple tyrosine motif-containing protein [Williamwhitmania taraxaci]SDC62250.1 regulatory protein, luxR family [Williamwhitmania taraxaci]